MFARASIARHKRLLALLGVGSSLLGMSLWFGATRFTGEHGADRSRPATPPKSSALFESSTQSANSLPSANEDIRVTLGRKMFFDPKLSVPEGTSCATCHDPSHGYAGNNGSTLGVARGSARGRFARRNTPSVLYLRFVRPFHLEWEEEAELPEAFGGFFWDGRSSSIARLVAQPLLNPNEMGNPNPRRIAQALRASAYASELSAEFDDVFETPEKTLEALGFCLEAFLTSPALSPFSSKYDQSLRGRVELSALEAKGLALFDDRSKGACSSCHKFDDRSRMPERSLFTDYGYDTVAVPRNRNIPGNRDPRHVDLGVCERHDPKLHTEDAWFCGSFRTPSLRNVATRSSFMHNGAFSNLRDVVSFYATRGSDPKRWYPSGSFDDLPMKYQKYVNTNVAPYNQAAGDPPALSEQDIDAIVAFLGTLTDLEYPKAP
jgi:cytochrome c peroxidase